METVTIRRKRFDEHKVTIESNSFKSGDMWFNTLYIIFFKEDYPKVKYPELVNGWRAGEMRFDYYNSTLANLDWHGGITFYQETVNPESNKTLVKAGCDYQHLHDDDWMSGDNGEAILLNNSERLLKEFLELAS